MQDELLYYRRYKLGGEIDLTDIISDIFTGLSIFRKKALAIHSGGEIYYLAYYGWDKKEKACIIEYFSTLGPESSYVTIKENSITDRETRYITFPNSNISLYISAVRTKKSFLGLGGKAQVDLRRDY